MAVVAVGTSEEVTQCECCGRSDLKKTVHLVWTLGEGRSDILGEGYYGTQCAAKALGGTSKEWSRAASGADLKRQVAVSYAKDWLRHYAKEIADTSGTYPEERFAVAWCTQNKLDRTWPNEERALKALAENREIVATNGISALLCAK